MHDQDVVLGSEVDDALEELHRGGLSRRHVGVIDEHHLHAVEAGPFDGLEIGVEVRLLVERIGQHHAAGQPHGGRIGRIAGVGHEDLVARVEERHADVHDTLLRTDERQHLAVVVEFGAVPLLVPVGKSLAQDGLTLVGHVFVDIGTLRLAGQTVDDGLVGREVGTSHSEFDDLTTGSGLDFRDFAQAARKIVLADAVQTV